MSKFAVKGGGTQPGGHKKGGLRGGSSYSKPRLAICVLGELQAASTATVATSVPGALYFPSICFKHRHQLRSRQCSRHRRFPRGEVGQGRRVAVAINPSRAQPISPG